MENTCPKFKFNHVGMNVTDIDRSIKWYRENLGYKYMCRDQLESERGGFVVAYLQNEGHYIELFSRPDGQKLPPEVEGSSIGTRHFCISVSREDFFKMKDYLVSRNIEVVNEMYHPAGEVCKPDGLYCMFFLDPDGNRVEVLEDFRPGTYHFPRPGDPDDLDVVD